MNKVKVFLTSLFLSLLPEKCVAMNNTTIVSATSSIGECTFLIGLLGLIGVFLYKLYNVINACKIYTIHKSIVLFVFSLIMMFFVLVSSIATLDILMLSYLKFASLLLILTFILTVVEVLMWLGKAVSK